MAVECLGSAARMARRHRSLSMSLGPLAMKFMFLLVSSHLIAFSIGLPVPAEQRSTNNTNASIITNATTHASNETTNATSLCAKVRCEPHQECVVSEWNEAICVNESDNEKEHVCSDHPVCGNDGLTYKNDCELKEKGIGLKHNGSCFSCQTQKAMYEPYNRFNVEHFTKGLEFITKCNEVTINDVLSSEFFDPKCEEQRPDVFLLNQAFEFHDVCAYYWCSTPDGVVIEDTFQRSKPDCISRSSCVVDDKVYHDGSVFLPECGICECLDGKIECIDEFCGVSGNLTDDQLDVLRNDIYQLFYFQFQFSDHVLIDLRHVRKNPAKKNSEDIACSVLDWKFQYYDVNGDGALQSYEQYKFVDEVHDLINFAEFEEQLITKMDTNRDKLIQFAEWFAYFTADVTEGNNGASVQWSCKQSIKTR